MSDDEVEFRFPFLSPLPSFPSIYRMTQFTQLTSIPTPLPFPFRGRGMRF